mgnify:CR=1 FL=1
MSDPNWKDRLIGYLENEDREHAHQTALAALESGELEKAESELQRARFAEPDNPVVSYNLGVVSYRRRDYQKAAGFFMQSAAAAGADMQVKFDSLYNLGNTAFKAGDYAAAVSAYNGSLEVRDDPQARYNLEVASKKLQEQQEKQQQQQENGLTQAFPESVLGYLV